MNTLTLLGFKVITVDEIHFTTQTCFIVMAGLQSLSSSSIDRQTVPDGYTFGWKSGGSNLPERWQNVKWALCFRYIIHTKQKRLDY